MMSRIILVVFTAVLLPYGSTAAEVASEHEPQTGQPNSIGSPRKVPFMHTGIDQAWASAQSSQLPLFLYMTSDNCLYCKKMIRETLSHPQVGARIMKYSEAVAVNASTSPKLAKKLGVRAFPTVLLISPQSEILCKVEGFLNPQEFAERLWPALHQAEQDRRVARTATSGGRNTLPAAQ